jgi:hypothetical protein
MLDAEPYNRHDATRYVFAPIVCVHALSSKACSYRLTKYMLGTIIALYRPTQRRLSGRLA